jgi:hypothetical protein
MWEPEAMMARAELLDLVAEATELVDRALIDADGNQDREPYNLPVPGRGAVSSELVAAFNRLRAVRDALAIGLG